MSSEALLKKKKSTTIKPVAELLLMTSKLSRDACIQADVCPSVTGYYYIFSKNPTLRDERQDDLFTTSSLLYLFLIRYAAWLK